MPFVSDPKVASYLGCQLALVLELNKQMNRCSAGVACFLRLKNPNITLMNAQE